MTAKAAKCPICGKAGAAEKTAPFCSPRCANLDLGRWLGEGYRIETHDADEENLSLPNPDGNEEG